MARALLPLLLVGCSLVTDFDKTLSAAGGEGDGGILVGDAAPADAAADVPAPDARAPTEREVLCDAFCESLLECASEAPRGRCDSLGAGTINRAYIHGACVTECVDPEGDFAARETGALSRLECTSAQTNPPEAFCDFPDVCTEFACAGVPPVLETCADFDAPCLEACRTRTSSEWECLGREIGFDSGANFCRAVRSCFDFE